MKAISLFCFLVMSFILVATSAWADVFVISNASGVAAADIKDIFLGESSLPAPSSSIRSTTLPPRRSLRVKPCKWMWRNTIQPGQKKLFATVLIPLR